MKRIITLIVLFCVLVSSCLFVSFYKDNTVIYDDVVLINDHLVRIEGEMNKQMADYAINLFSRVYSKYLSDNNCYFALIPDKSKYLIDDGYVQYTEFFSYMCDGLYFAQPIDIYDKLSFDDYYVSDLHWRQEKITDVADVLLSQMGKDSLQTYTTNKADEIFLGDYARKSNKKIPAEDMFYLTNETIDNLEIREDVEIYDFDKLSTNSQYEFFLSGNQSVVTIENNAVSDNSRLVIFRDSFSSAIAPLMCENYSQIVLIDLRYILSDMISDYVDFEDADVLFLYSTTMINNSLAMK